MQPQPSLFFFTLSTLSHTLSHILSYLSTQQLSNLCGQQNSFNSHIETAYNFPIWQQSRRLLLNTACRSLDYLLDLLDPFRRCLVPLYIWKLCGNSTQLPYKPLHIVIDFVIAVHWTVWALHLLSPPNRLYQCFLIDQNSIDWATT